MCESCMKSCGKMDSIIGTIKMPNEELPEKDDTTTVEENIALIQTTSVNKIRPRREIKLEP